MEAGNSTDSRSFERFNAEWIIFTAGLYVILGIILPFLQYFGGFISYFRYMGGSDIPERMDFYWNTIEWSNALGSGSKSLLSIAFDSGLGLIWIAVQIWGIIWILSQIVAVFLLIIPIINRIKIERSRKIELTKLGFKIGLIGVGVEYLLYLILIIFENWELGFETYVVRKAPSINLFLLFCLALAWLMYYLGYSSVTSEFPDV